MSIEVRFQYNLLLMGQFQIRRDYSATGLPEAITLNTLAYNLYAISR